MIPFRRAGFTLLEICLALLIGAMLILLAIPNIAGLLAEQRLKQSFERLDRLVAEARQKSVTDQQTYMLTWEKDQIRLAAAAPNTESRNDAVSRLVFEDGESFQLRRSAALRQDAPAVWTFWPNGICEPAQIAFQDKAGSWLVRYDPLTARGTFLQSEVP